MANSKTQSEKTAEAAKAEEVAKKAKEEKPKRVMYKVVALYCSGKNGKGYKAKEEVAGIMFNNPEELERQGFIKKIS
jgi:hypothetical protein